MLSPERYQCLMTLMRIYCCSPGSGEQQYMHADINIQLCEEKTNDLPPSSFSPFSADTGDMKISLHFVGTIIRSCALAQVDAEFNSASTCTERKLQNMDIFNNTTVNNSPW